MAELMLEEEFPDALRPSEGETSVDGVPVGVRPHKELSLHLIASMSPSAPPPNTVSQGHPPPSPPGLPTAEEDGIQVQITDPIKAYFNSWGDSDRGGLGYPTVHGC